MICSTSCGDPQRSDASRYQVLAAPGYYALYTFAQHAQGKSLLPATAETGVNIKAYAVREGETGAVTVFVLNKDLLASGTVSVKVSPTMGTASLLMVSAPALTSNQVAYGGASFDPKTGRLRGTPETTSLEGANDEYRFQLPNASVAVLTIQPREKIRNRGGINELNMGQVGQGF